MSAFGGVIATNVPVSVAMAEQVAEVFTEVVVAPAYDDGAVEVLAAQEEHPAAGVRRRTDRGGAEIRPISGGLLMQHRDVLDAWSTGRRRPGDLDAGDRRGGLARGARRPGVRLAGVPGREVQRDPARQGRRLGRASGWARSTGSTRAGSRWRGRGTGRPGSVAASDAFFPFEDGPQILIDARVAAIVQPGGSVRDELTIEACKAAGVTMYFTGHPALRALSRSGRMPR